MASDSGWRDLDLAHVNDLVSLCLLGQYKKTSMGKPQAHVDKNSAVDGKKKWLNGKHNHAAILKCKKIHRLIEDGDEDTIAKYGEAEFTELLVADFVAMDVDLMKFPDSHDEAHWYYAYCVNVHDESSNAYKKTGVKDMVTVATNEKARLGDASWEEVTRSLSEFYGNGKRMFTYRCIIFAQTL